MNHKVKSWIRIRKLGQKSGDFELNKLFRKNPSRGKDFVKNIADINFDYSKSRINTKALFEFSKFAKEVHLQKQIDQILDGELMNNTEFRSVGHIWLRSTKLRPKNISEVSEIEVTQKDFLTFSDQVRSGSIKSITGKVFTDVLNIGIGGSDLGPAMVYKALNHIHDSKINCHFVSNIDELEISSVLNKLNPDTTLIVVTSKTFTTAETMKNAEFAKRWLSNALGEKSIKNHVVAISTNTSACKNFGIDEAKIFPFWDWVGGRYSLFSSVGISIALGYGSQTFTDLQLGASKIDMTLKNVDFDNYAPFIHAAINIWNLNVLKLRSLAVIPYVTALSRFPAFLQQLWMESNGKSVDRAGKPVKFNTCPVIFGEPGTNSQHSFFQFLHQGTEIVPVDFVVITNELGSDREFKDSLFANALAQSSVLAFGISKEELKEQGVKKELISHKVMPGNRPSNIISIPRLDAVMLGELIAFYETSVILQGLMMNINSFDQWGVELGKKTASRVLSFIKGRNQPDMDSSTNNQVKRYLS